MNIVCEVVCVEQGYLVTKRVSVQVGKRVEFIVRRGPQRATCTMTAMNGNGRYHPP